MAPGGPPRGHPDHAPEGLGHPAGEGGHRIVAPGAARRRPASILVRAAELAAAGEPFALATVVAVERPTSARPGAQGIIHPDRTIEGWVGGSCAQPVVVREALRAIAEGRPRLLRLSRDGGSGARRSDGTFEFVMTCHSGGTLEIYVEPHLPAPALWVAGVTPIACALAELGSAAGYRVTVFDPFADPDAFPTADRVLADTELRRLDADTAPWIVVATQGQWDEEALAAALRREASYVGLVASPRRAAAVRSFLQEAGVAEAALGRLHAPAGLDLGAETPEEIAISILAELIRLRRDARDAGVRPAARSGAETDGAVADAPGSASGGATGEADSTVGPATAPNIVLRDPVCGMTVDAGDVRHVAEFGGVVYAFCRLGCRTRFVRDPSAYLPAVPATA